MEDIKIETLDQLKNLFTDPQYGSNGCAGEFYIDFGGLRSWKQIFYNDVEDLFFITNEIDDSEDVFTSDEIMDATITPIPTAMKKGTFYFAWF